MTVRRRLILDLAPGVADRARLQVAAEIARQLGADLHGVFVEDEALFHLADLPFAREIRLPGHQWRPLDPAALARELAAAAVVAHQMLDETVRGLGMAGAFEVRRGDPASCLAALLGDADVIALPVPLDARRRAGSYQASAAILLLPARPVQQDGPVVVVTGGRPGPAVDLAVRCALAGGTRLLILAGSTAAGDDAAGRARGLGMKAGDVGVQRLDGTGDAAVTAALDDVGERLIVLQGDDGHDHEHPLAAVLLAARGVPVLLVAGRRGG